MSNQDTSALQNTATSYDEFRYQSKPFQASHPALLQGIAALFGIQTKSMNKARILELGCASGGNLIPLAYCQRHLKIDHFMAQSAVEF